MECGECDWIIMSYFPRSQLKITPLPQMGSMENEDACTSADIFKEIIAHEKEEDEGPDGEEVHWPVYMGILKKCDMGYLKVPSAPLCVCVFLPLLARAEN